MGLLPNIIVNTLVLASMYILASLGFAFIFNMLGSVNLAHGAFYMLAAYITYYLCAKAGLNNWLAMLLSAVILAALALPWSALFSAPSKRNLTAWSWYPLPS